ncbi:MAG: inorganic phosphate transporter, partial [Bacteroidia bacterium]
GHFAVDSTIDLQKVNTNIAKIEALMIRADSTVLSAKEKKLYADIFKHATHYRGLVGVKKSASEIDVKDRFSLRKDLVKVTKGSEKLMTGGNLALSLNEIKELKHEVSQSKKLIEYAPTWVILMISVCLGLGTMVGWKRIVKTVGEKIGKQHMSYAQGASAEIVASLGIGLASWKGLPVSTTHMLSSGIAGTMVAKKGLKNLQKKTVKTIVLAWVLTLPVTMVLAGGLFLLFRAIL